MNKFIAIAAMAAVLTFVGAGCEVRKTSKGDVQPSVAPETLSDPGYRKCSGEATSLAMNTAIIPEDPSGFSNTQSALDAECQTAITQKPAYHLIKFSKGPDSAEAAQELLAGLENTYYLLGACKNDGFAWSTVAQRTEPLARFECRMNCAPDPAAAGQVVCESTAYRGLQYVNVKPPAANTVDLSNQGLTKVSADVFKWTKTEALDLSGNRLTGAIPAEIRLLTKLKILDLSDNELTGVPAEVGQLRDLETLDLSNNKLTGLPYELRNLSKLQVLDLSGNPYSEVDLEYIRQGLPNTTFITK